METAEHSPQGSGPVRRSDWRVTASVWHALFLRELMVRVFAKRAGALWLIAEPMANIVILAFIFSAVRVRHIGGIDTAVWVMGGMLGFFLFRRTAMIAMRAISMNRALFTYRQVRPVDTVLVRGSVEGVVMLFVSLILLAGAALLDVPVVPDDPLLVVSQMLVLWLLGIGFGLVTSVLTELIQELGEVINLTMMPLFFLSGVIIPISVVPQPYRDWIMVNPLIHAIEGVRLGFASHYHPVPDLDLWYPFWVMLVLVVLGLALNRHFESRLLAL